MTYFIPAFVVGWFTCAS